MENTKDIINAYREGDFETRLHIFLNYRDLRDEFEDIEDRESRDGQTVESASKAKGWSIFGLGRSILSAPRRGWAWHRN